MNYTKYWIALEQTKGIGPAHLMEIHTELQKQNISIIDIIDLTPEEIHSELKLGPGISKLIPESKKELEKIESEYLDLLDRGFDVLPFFSPVYPERLKELLGSGFPPILYTAGNKDLLNKRGIALLGDRSISEKGMEICYMGAKTLARHSLTVISGMASGADNTAHRAALENGGDTVAFIPSGINRINPPDFMTRMLESGNLLIVSAFFPAKEADKYSAFIRNRILIALSHAVYIVEAPVEGGIMEAAKSAEKLGIPLFTTEYSEYPESASGNSLIIEKHGGAPVRGRRENNILVPNMDRMIGIARYE
jgi:DNA protecting protein DprA